jgi:hypothetical protein
VRAEESWRIEAGAANWSAAIKNQKPPNANHAHGIITHQFCQNVYGKPGALFSVNRLLRRRSHKRLRDDVFLIGRAMVWKSRTN